MSTFFSSQINCFCLTRKVEDIWADVALERGMPVGEGATSLSEVIDLHVLMFPHYRHQEAAFQEQVSKLRDSLYDKTIAKDEYSKLIPANGISTYAQTLWESITTNAVDTRALASTDAFSDRKADDFYNGEDIAIVAGYRYDEAFSDKLAEASGDIADLLDKVDNGERLNNLGQTADTIVNLALQEYML